MQIINFKDMYLAELQELALRQMAEVASHHELRNALIRHGEETMTQRQRLVSILEKHGAKETHTDQAMQALLNETKKMVSLLKGDDLRDAGLIASVQKLEHYEIAAYGTAAALAGQLDLRDDQRMLHESLEEERKTDDVLTKLAKGKVNQDALAA
jgi:ferritin-like metal-binding protein YciE